MTTRTRVLVTYASRMGSTQEIAETIGRELQTFGIDVVVAPCADNVNPEGFEGVIIGSAIYTRRWLKAATKYLKRHAHGLDPKRHGCFTAVRAAKERRRTGARAKGCRRAVRYDLPAPVTFGGRLDIEHATGPVSRWMGADGPLSGDFRDWDRIRAWAAEIAHQLDPATAGKQ